jgi:beta-phosphoglucomutase-like phosphatase (HAD superfamily)
MPAGAVLFDFNGTLSDDEGIMCEIFQALFAEKGKPLTERDLRGCVGRPQWWRFRAAGAGGP